MNNKVGQVGEIIIKIMNLPEGEVGDNDGGFVVEINHEKIHSTFIVRFMKR